MAANRICVADLLKLGISEGCKAAPEAGAALRNRAAQTREQVASGGKSSFLHGKKKFKNVVFLFV